MLQLLAIAVILATPSPQAATAPPNPALIRVFVQTEDGGESHELADRRRSVKDLMASLAAKKKSIVVVDSEDRADLVLDVLDRAVTVPKVVMGLNPRPGDPSNIAGMTGPVRAAVLRTKLEFGAEAPEFTNKNKPAESSRGWQSAADDIVSQIDKWISGHRAEILRRRK